ncbi:DNA gyrase subunit A [Paenibacillus glucanolyticus]|jgi:DNA gyrase subunit A|uniref:DNA gyrase subunit A n=2 Tax=Paenibacillus glucanolyticus TaxID=59843 RepID=A0A163IWY3_9BACL|nr:MULTISPECIES: DNA gyrase subunit A [Paenibacillus]ANA80194.1 DNA gyrase subunit A [Paenibacillus glucanolyticus]AVV55738.1 DNA gyrase subunit A [Paenibacillus glucanolyticus]AWP30318.1 DNA gyrase subunit A [Paenibacillus sp. Cedars]ETT38609.1 DNA gyrase subunit A [Paenibacillus sp. FSL R5-808]KZS46210.1 DNA gyrase subunit A [Paenibacillus glucanolyticus]
MAEENFSQIKDRDIGTEMRESFMDYAMSIIVSRALPDVRDGMKPVHRRILYAMSELGMAPDKPHKKSARIVGEVIGKYHPHGDSAVYESMVRMAQDFSMRYMLVDGHGNFGSIDGDMAAAMRYTEARLSKIAMEMLRDINKETIDFAPNYDGEEHEPVVLPARYPNLLVNGVSGIAVGMATNIPPHNLGEVIDGVQAMIRNPDITPMELMEYIQGPDFPTAGFILGREGIRQAYRTGRGSVTMRAKATIEENNNKARIVVHEIPYQVNKARLVEKIAELVRDKRIDGITDLRDESDRNGMRIVIELRRDVNPNVVLNNLYKHTAMQSNFGINMLAIVNNEPKILNLRDVLFYYLEHQVIVIRRRTEFELRKAEARAHILEGLRIALDHLDEVIALIRASQTTEAAREGLIERFGLSQEQAQAILDMRLQRLTGLEREKIENEYQELLAKIAELREILANEHLVLQIINDELQEIKERFSDERRTEITVGEDSILDEDLIPREEVIITITHTGYIKRLPANTYRSQKRGGRGVVGMDTKSEDFVEHLFVTNSHHYLMFFTDKGKAYRLKAYEIPELSRTARGTPIINLIQIEQGESINAVIPVENFDSDNFLFFATRQGVVKKTPLEDYVNIRKGGLIAINLREDDSLIEVKLTDGQQEIIIGTAQGMSIRFKESDVRSMGRSATGVKGITLDDDDEVIGMDVVDRELDILIVTTKGYGKRTPASDYRSQTRGGKGIKTINITEKNGPVVALKVVKSEEDLMIITSSGTIIRTSMEGISTMGRYAQGVKLINIREDDSVGTVCRADKSDDPEPDDEDEEGQDGDTTPTEATEE